MRTIFSLVAALTVLASAITRSNAEVEITYQEFYDGLAPYGDWLYVDSYGYCWQPRVEEGWRPYTNGSWIYTDAGWTWSSDDEWGWATDHYGRWMITTEFGWLWVPGYEWAPAWVSWRKSDDYVGWAPLPPEAAWQPASGFGPSVDVSFSIGPDYYNFCPVRHLGAPRLRPYILPPRENVTIINKTVNVTKITNVNNVMIFNEGPDFTEIETRTEQPIRRARIERRWDVSRETVRAGEIRNTVEGDVFRVAAPRVERPTREERPPKVAATIRREEFDKRIGQERRRVRERTREMDQSNVPPPPEGGDQRFEPSRRDVRDVPEDRRVTEGQARRERGGREFESERLRSEQQPTEDQTRGRDRQMRQERRAGREEPSQTPAEVDQQTPPSSQAPRDERRRGRSDAQGPPQREMRQDQEGRDAQRRQQRRTEQPEESLQGSPPAQPGETPTRQSVRERTQRGGSEGQRPPQDRRAERRAAQEADVQGRQGRGVDQSEQSLQGSPPPVSQPRERSRRRGSEGQRSREAREESQRDSQDPTAQRKAEAPPRETAQPPPQGGENIRREQRSGPPAERRESNVQQQRPRGDQAGQGERSGRPQGQKQQSRGDRQKGDKSGSKGEEKSQSSEEQGQDGGGQ